MEFRGHSQQIIALQVDRRIVGTKTPHTAQKRKAYTAQRSISKYIKISGRLSRNNNQPGPMSAEIRFLH